MKRPNHNFSKRLRRVAMSPDWRAGYLAGRAGRPPVVPPEITDADAWRDGYAIGLRPGRRRLQGQAATVTDGSSTNSGDGDETPSAVH